MFSNTAYNYENFSRGRLLKDVLRRKMQGPRPGERAPDFKLRSLDGDKVRLSDFRGNKNVVLTFGSASCPMTAGSIGGLNQLYEDFEGEDVKFFLVYVREAHPGELLPHHGSMDDKIAAAERLREEEDLAVPVLLDELDGRVHRRYGGRPNPTYIIDKSGRVAFRSTWTRPGVIREALEELLEVQEKREVDHAVVGGGEDRSIPLRYGMLHTHRALERSGRKASREFRESMGVPGRVAMTASRIAEPIAMHPFRVFTGIAIASGVIALGLFGGFKLRQRRFRMRHEPYYFPRVGRRPESGEYEAVGI